ncbi:MAG: hypothetical protein WCK78_03155 [Paludibacter sp.]
MKYIVRIIVMLLLTLSNVYGQHSQDRKEVSEIIRAQDSIPRKVFLDSTFLPNMKVNVKNTIQIWDCQSKTEKHIYSLCDLRIKFANHDSALKFHKKYLQYNSENGPEIRNHRIDSNGADEFKVFNGSYLYNQMLSSGGLQIYCYLFVVDNYYVKVFITCNKDYKPEKFQDLVKDIITRIKK